MERILVNSDKYYSKYVAMKSIEDIILDWKIWTTQEGVKTWYNLVYPLPNND